MNQKNTVTLSQYSKRTGHKHPKLFYLNKKKGLPSQSHQHVNWHVLKQHKMNQEDLDLSD